jgi:ABC-2 type transport system permease protein
MKFKQKDILFFVAFVAGIIGVCLLVNALNLRFDLTADKRYTLSSATRKMLREQKELVYVKVYLEGEMPVSMRPLQRAVRDMLQDMKSFSRSRISFEFINPSSEKSRGEREKTYRELMRKGLFPFTMQEKNAEGGVTQMDLFPGAIISLGGKQAAVNFVQSNMQVSTEENVNNAIQNIEYALLSAVEALTRKEQKRIAFIEGHGELSAAQVGDITRELSPYYKVNRVTLGGEVSALNTYDLAIVAKPTKPWSEADKLVVDQFIMRGGKVAWFVEPVHVHEDSLANGHLTFGFTNDVNLDDILFQYGVRVNANVVQDLQCAMIPVNVSPAGMPAKFAPLPWTYYPLLSASSGSAISRNLNVVKTEFPSTIDTLSTQGVAKEILLTTSQHSLIKSAPFYVGLEQVTEDIDVTLYSKKSLPVAALLQGEFSSIFQHRVLNSFNNGRKFDFTSKSKFSKQIIVADGDVIRNDVMANGTILPLGYDRYTKQILYGNKDFVKNVVNFLCDDSGLMSLRGRVVALRLLDRARVVRERNMWIVINTVVPIAALIAGGLVFVFLRKRKYAR